MSRRMFVQVAGMMAAAAVAVPDAAPQAPALDEVLRRGATYVSEYAGKLSGTTLEELMLLSENSGNRLIPPRRIASDLLLLRINQEGRIFGLRDPYAIDTKPLRERRPRIANALAEPTTDSWQVAQNHAREHAVYLGHNVVLWFSDPSLALQFISMPHQSRVTYKIEGNKRMNDTPVVGVGFKEKEEAGRQYLLNTPGNPIASGRLWIDPATGAIHQTELWVPSKTDTARLLVSYAPDKTLGLLLPKEASGTFEWREEASGGNIGPGGRRITFEANTKYSNPRHRPIDLSRIAK
jgi:hypothetical protein